MSCCLTYSVWLFRVPLIIPLHLTCCTVFEDDSPTYRMYNAVVAATLLSLNDVLIFLQSCGDVWVGTWEFHGFPLCVSHIDHINNNASWAIRFFFFVCVSWDIKTSFALIILESPTKWISSNSNQEWLEYSQCPFASGHTNMYLGACLSVSLCVLAERKGVGCWDTEADRKRSSWFCRGWGFTPAIGSLEQYTECRLLMIHWLILNGVPSGTNHVCSYSHLCARTVLFWLFAFCAEVD